MRKLVTRSLRRLLLPGLLLGTLAARAQNVGIGASNPTEKLEVRGGNVLISTAGKGLVFSDGSLLTTAGPVAKPMTSAQREALSGSTPRGTLVYQTDGTPGIYYYTGAAWVNLTTGRPADANGYAQVPNEGGVSTLAGTVGTSGSADGPDLSASFNGPAGVAVDAAGTIYVADQGNSTIRKITPAGVVSTFAGLAGTQGSADGAGAVARFKIPTGLAIDASGTLYVADLGNSTIRKITSAGVVSTFAGLAGSTGTANGVGGVARFKYPSGVAVDAAGRVYVADQQNQLIRKITATGTVSTLAGSAGFAGSSDVGFGVFNFPSGVAVDASGTVYVADEGNNTIRKITATGTVSTLAGSAGTPGTPAPGSANGTGAAARFNSPYGIAVDISGTLFVADLGNNTIRKITPAGVVSTLAGRAGTAGSSDGPGSVANFNSPTGIAVDGAGVLYVTDAGNQLLRVIK